MKEISKTYNPKDVEDQIYKEWEDSGFFNPDNLDCEFEAETFSISMPPPNVTGTLHVGHASALTYEDLMTRYNRLLGKRTLYLPGEDHAAIATQTKVEKILQKEGKTRHDLGRADFLKRVNDFAMESRDTIRNQIKRMGTSCDWSRERYTLDEGLTKAVETTFINMFNDGMVYRGDRIVNWCPRCHSTLADDEVEYKEQQSTMWYIKYGPFIIATTRPETKLADTGVAVNPKDKRYKDYIDKELEIDLAGHKIKVKVFADHEVDMEFGSGAVGVTPAHSQVDYEWANKYGLEIIKLIDEDGILTDAGGKYKEMKVEEAREAFVKDLKAAGQIEKEEDYDNKLSICYRCDTPVEPLTSLQWFIDVNKSVTFPDGQTMSIKERAIDEVRSGRIKIIPKRFEKAYMQWMENLRDWCISRQIWFGHGIPVCYCEDCQAVIVSKDKIEKCDKCSSNKIRKDEDTLDTWFSSGIWTFSTLGWPDNQKRKDYEKGAYEDKNDLERFHPTSVMETGRDIIFFWVARMIIMSTYCLGEHPFEHVYLHGMITAKDGSKMSKSKGNGVDPIDMIEKYGADALRISMIVGATPGNDLKFYEEKVEGWRNFVNKLWNISRFTLMSVSEIKSVEKMPEPKTLADKWILANLNQTVVEVTNHLDKYEFSAAVIFEKFLWSDFADWYIEIAKQQLSDEEMKTNTENILLFVLERVLILFHPFIPFVTEKIWSFFEQEELLMVKQWPEVFIDKLDTQSIDDFELVKKIISAIRNLRAEYNIEPAKKIRIMIYSKDEIITLANEITVLTGLARLEGIEFIKENKGLKNVLTTVVEGIEIFIPLEGVLDVKKEKERLKREIAQSEKFIKSVMGKMKNVKFLKNAPQEIVDKEKEKLASQEEKLNKLKEQLANLK